MKRLVSAPGISIGVVCSTTVVVDGYIDAVGAAIETNEEMFDPQSDKCYRDWHCVIVLVLVSDRYPVGSYQVVDEFSVEYCDFTDGYIPYDNATHHYFFAGALKRLAEKCWGKKAS